MLPLWGGFGHRLFTIVGKHLTFLLIAVEWLKSKSTKPFQRQPSLGPLRSLRLLGEGLGTNKSSHWNRPGNKTSSGYSSYAVDCNWIRQIPSRSKQAVLGFEGGRLASSKRKPRITHAHSPTKTPQNAYVHFVLFGRTFKLCMVSPTRKQVTFWGTSRNACVGGRDLFPVNRQGGKGLQWPPLMPNPLSFSSTSALGRSHNFPFSVVFNISFSCLLLDNISHFCLVWFGD